MNYAYYGNVVYLQAGKFYIDSAGTVGLLTPIPRDEVVSVGFKHGFKCFVPSGGQYVIL